MDVTRREGKKGELMVPWEEVVPGSAVMPSSPQCVAYMWQVF